MKKILIVICDMQIGGAQKSLLSFLQCLKEQQLQYEIDLLVIDPAGPFYSQLPDNVRLVQPSRELRWLGGAMSRKLLQEHFSFKALLGEIKWLVTKNAHSQLNLPQRLWRCWKSRIPQHPQAYDVAISYNDGVSGYYVMEKVQAQKKVLWVHSEYQKLRYDLEFDRPYYLQADRIVTISQVCKDCIIQAFPQFADKTFILENITRAQAVKEGSRRGECPEFQREGLRLLSVARLNPVKGIDLAVEAAQLLKRRNIPFYWLVLGDGPQRQQLQQQIDSLQLSEEFILLGSRENPYPYMAACDILVQPSRVEGRSIVLDEAMILCKPIVATCYATVTDILTHGQTGYITKMDPLSLADGICRLWQDEALRRKLTDCLKSLENQEKALLERYIAVML